MKNLILLIFGLFLAQIIVAQNPRKHETFVYIDTGRVTQSDTLILLGESWRGPYEVECFVKATVNSGTPNCYIQTQHKPHGANTQWKTYRWDTVTSGNLDFAFPLLNRSGGQERYYIRTDTTTQVTVFEILTQKARRIPH